MEQPNTEWRTPPENARRLDERAMKQLLSSQEALLDTIDELRTLGIGRIVDLPQLIVCGDQSSGKSSVLEAISRVRFPVKEGVCTRFATEIILRRAPTTRVTVTIQPGPSRANRQSELNRLAEFNESKFDGEDLPGLIEKAKSYMGIQGASKTFTDDVLRVELSGPDKPHLTIVDLPGIYHTQSKEQGSAGIAVVRELVSNYMKNRNSIIMAVVSAQYEINLQAILEMAEEHDPERTRTLGIITKPDTLKPGSGDAQKYISIAKNQIIPLPLGWNALKNRDFETRNSTDDERDAAERDFFSTGGWASVPRDRVGIDSLRKRLSEVLLKHIKAKLPELMNDIEKEIEARAERLKSLGDPRPTTKDQRIYLGGIAKSFENFTCSAVKGDYTDNKFFGSLYHEQPDADLRKLRALVRKLNNNFSTVMYQYGHSRTIDRSSQNRTSGVKKTRQIDPRSVGFKVQEPDHIGLTELEEEIARLAEPNRGQEFPGDTNPLLVTALFQEQSKPWEDIASQHLHMVLENVHDFVAVLMSHVANEHTRDMLLSGVIDTKLEEMQLSLKEKLSELLTCYKTSPPVPLDAEFLEEMQEAQSWRWTRRIVSHLDTHFMGRWTLFDNEGKPVDLDNISRLVRPDSKTVEIFGASRVIDQMEAYYNMTISTFIENVVILAVENCVMSKLSNIFTTDTVEDIADDKERLAELAGEPEEVMAERQQLNTDIAALKKGLTKCRKFGVRELYTQRAANASATRRYPVANSTTVKEPVAPQDAHSATDGSNADPSQATAPDSAGLSHVFDNIHISTPTEEREPQPSSRRPKSRFQPSYETEDESGVSGPQPSATSSPPSQDPVTSSGRRRRPGDDPTSTSAGGSNSASSDSTLRPRTPSPHTSEVSANSTPARSSASRPSPSSSLGSEHVPGSSRGSPGFDSLGRKVPQRKSRNPSVSSTYVNRMMEEDEDEEL